MHTIDGQPAGTCKIILRDLLSARGLYLDPYHRYLYIVDHKKRVIKRTRLLASVDEVATLNEDLSSTTILSTDIAHDLGDLFYMTVYGARTASSSSNIPSPVVAAPNTNPPPLTGNTQYMLIWSEFSGKIRMSQLNDTAHSRVIFTTSEYTYSVNVMDNSTNSGYYKTNVVPATTTVTTTTTTSTIEETTEEATTTEEDVMTTTEETTTTTMTTTFETTTESTAPTTTEQEIIIATPEAVVTTVESEKNGIK